MTGIRDPQQDGSIQAMLHDAGLEASTALRGSLEELRALVPGRAPAPRADLAALLAAGTHDAAAPTAVLPTAAVTAAESSAEEPLPVGAFFAGVTGLAERRGRKRRLAMVGGVVVGAMSLGAGAVAASSEDFRHNIGQTIGVLFLPAGHAPAPAPERAQPSPSSIPAAPAPTALAPAPSAAPSGTGTLASPGVQKPETPPGTPPAVGRGGILPVPAQRPVTPALPSTHSVPVPSNGQDLPHAPGPVSSTLPGVVPTPLPGQP